MLTSVSSWTEWSCQWGAGSVSGWDSNDPHSPLPDPRRSASLSDAACTSREAVGGVWWLPVSARHRAGRPTGPGQTWIRNLLIWTALFLFPHRVKREGSETRLNKSSAAFKSEFVTIRKFVWFVSNECFKKRKTVWGVRELRI